MYNLHPDLLQGTAEDKTKKIPPAVRELLKKAAVEIRRLHDNWQETEHDMREVQAELDSCSGFVDHIRVEPDPTSPAGEPYTRVYFVNAGREERMLGVCPSTHAEPMAAIHSALCDSTHAPKPLAVIIMPESIKLAKERGWT